MVTLSFIPIGLEFKSINDISTYENSGSNVFKKIKSLG